MRRRTRFASALLLVGMWSAPVRGRAEEPSDHERAGALYDEGRRAFDRGEVGRAAQAFAAADAIAPNPVALAAAFDAAVQADDAVLGAELCARAAERRLPEARDARGRKACRDFEARVGRLVLDCAPTPCSARIGSVVLTAGEVAFVEPGEHIVELRSPTGVSSRRVTALAGQTVAVRSETIAPVAPVVAPPPSPPADRQGGGPGPGWFIAGAGASVLLVGGSVASALDADARHDSFVSAGCPEPGDDRATCRSLADEGRGAEARTNVLIVTAAVIGIGTMVLGLVTDWEGEPSRDAGLLAW